MDVGSHDQSDRRNPFLAQYYRTHGGGHIAVPRFLISVSTASQNFEKAHGFARRCARWRLNCHGFGRRAVSTWSAR